MKNVLFLGIVLLSVACTSSNQDDEQKSDVELEKTEDEKDWIKFVKLDIRHSLIINRRSLKIELEQRHEQITAHVKSYPAPTRNLHLENAIIDTTFDISQEGFDLLMKELSKINTREIFNHFNIMGADGSTYQLEYGNSFNSIKITAWSPDYLTKKRKLNQYLAVIERLIEMVMFDPNEVL